MDGHYGILLHSGDYKKDILDIYFWPQEADSEAHKKCEDKLYAVILDRESCHCDRPYGITRNKGRFLAAEVMNS